MDKSVNLNKGNVVRKFFKRYASRKRLGTAASEREIVLFVSSFELKAEKKACHFLIEE